MATIVWTTRSCGMSCRTRFRCLRVRLLRSLVKTKTATERRHAPFRFQRIHLERSAAGRMDPTRLFAIISLLSLPTVMFGGLSLRRLLETSPGLTEFQRTYFRAGHAHAGVLLILSLIYL